MNAAESTNQDVKSTPATQQQNPAPDTSTSTAKEGSPKREYTQDELNDMFADRAKQAENSTLTRILKLLGVNSEAELPALKTTIEKATALEQANMTESQKLQAERDTLKKEKEDALAQLNAERAERRNDKIAAVITQAAQAMKANDADDVLTHARDKHKEELAALMDDKGEIDKKKVETLMEAIKKNKPHYFTSPASVPGSRSNNEGSRIPSDAEAMKRFSMNNQRAIRGR